MPDEVKLPEPKWQSLYMNTAEAFSSDQLRAYGEACRKDERENILQTLKETRIPDFSMPEQWFNDGVDAAISAIRARSRP
ncbi:hypothetical protein [Acetobacter sp. UBA5411]|uniref:hypothetical protein n=1 Tax=Acetobacter sp. UBA5411 TaxID=1945905 RepID=UPI0025B9B8F6|nr:hypothetical protein [Acetobacter sp. UBA5411]